MQRLISVWLILFGLFAALPTPATAGGDSYDEQLDIGEPGTVFFGVIRDARGLGMSGVEVTLKPAQGEAMALKTNILGLYHGKMSSDVPADSIEVIVHKPGYAVANIVQHKTQSRNLLIEANYTLQKQPQ